MPKLPRDGFGHPWLNGAYNYILWYRSSGKGALKVTAAWVRMQTDPRLGHDLVHMVARTRPQQTLFHGKVTQRSVSESKKTIKKPFVLK